MSKTPANYNTLYVNVTQVPITCSCGFVLWSFEKYGLEFGEKGFFFYPHLVYSGNWIWKGLALRVRDSITNQCLVG